MSDALEVVDEDEGSDLHLHVRMCGRRYATLYGAINDVRRGIGRVQWAIISGLGAVCVLLAGILVTIMQASGNLF